MTCSISECDADHYGKGWCKPHYNRWYRTGNPLPQPRKSLALPEEERVRRRRASQKRYRDANPEKIASWGKANPEKMVLHRRRHNLARYGLTPEQYDAMVVEQDGLCAICRLPETNFVKGTLSSLRVDHDHETGVNRELLCNRCNLRLGLLLEDPDWTENAMNYLKKHNV